MRLLVIVLFVCASSAHAATKVIDNGQLIGANNVVVGSTTYNVSFLDGTCIGIFSGCNEASDFTFSTLEEAAAAIWVLMDQVFIDDSFGNHDNDPALTRGCESLAGCSLLTPYSSFFTNSLAFDAVQINNQVDEQNDSQSDDFLGSGFWFADDDFTLSNTLVLAKWEEATPVPLPAAFWFMLSGLALLFRAKLSTCFSRSRIAV